MSLGHSPTDPNQPTRKPTMVEKVAAVIILVVLVVGALKL